MKNKIYLPILILMCFAMRIVHCQEQPICLDELSKTCNEGFCTTPKEKLCWLKDYLEKTNNSTTFFDQCETFNSTQEETKAISEINMPWGAYYFPYKNGGINFRWSVQSATLIATKKSDLNKAIISKMTTAELNTLSPSVKFDLWRGDANFSFSKGELTRRSKNRAVELKKLGIPISERNGGFCNGARAAGVLAKEPGKNLKVIKSLPGVQPFVVYIADQKALLAATFFHPQHTNNFGDNAFVDNGLNNEKCGIDPVTFDILLQLFVRDLQHPFFIDADRSSNLDNKTVLKYTRSVIQTEKTSAENTKSTVVVRVMVLAEFTAATSNTMTKKAITDAVKKTDLNKVPLSWINNFKISKYQYYQYKYEINYNTEGQMTSGKWVDEKLFTRPNFAWISWGKGNDDCSAYDNLESAGNPALDFQTLSKFLEE